jgi:hypothetical protein
MKFVVQSELSAEISHNRSVFDLHNPLFLIRSDISAQPADYFVAYDHLFAVSVFSEDIIHPANTQFDQLSPCRNPATVPAHNFVIELFTFFKHALVDGYTVIA